MALTFEQFLQSLGGHQPWKGEPGFPGGNMEQMPRFSQGGFTQPGFGPGQGPIRGGGQMMPNYGQPGFGPGQGPPRDGAPGGIHVPGRLPVPQSYYTPVVDGRSFSTLPVPPRSGMPNYSTMPIPPRGGGGYNPTLPGFRSPGQAPQYSLPGFGPGQGPARGPGQLNPPAQRLSPVVNPVRDRWGSGNGPFR